MLLVVEVVIVVVVWWWCGGGDGRGSGCGGRGSGFVVELAAACVLQVVLHSSVSQV